MIQPNLNHSLEVKSLVVSRSDIPVFESVNFKLEAGECIHISGANGVGKTTLLRAICGIDQHYEGKIIWNGHSNRHNDYHQHLLYLGHALGLKPKLTVEQNLNFYRALRFGADPGLTVSALNELGVGSYCDEYVERLSAGQKRRVALCRMITEPVSLWILDEPLVALDFYGQNWLQNTCNQHLAKGGLIVMTSHQPVTGIHGLRELSLA